MINTMMRHRTPSGERIWASKFVEILAGVLVENQALNFWETLKNINGYSAGIESVFETSGHIKLSTAPSNTPFVLTPLKQQPVKVKSKHNNPLSIHFNLPIVLYNSIDDIDELPVVLMVFSDLVIHFLVVPL